MNASSFFGHVERSVFIGLRKVRVVRDAIKEGNGALFHFEVNNKSIFAKGSNLIPFETWSTDTTREQMRWVLRSAQAANMNMVRVWGGGRYLPDSFYRLADKLGLLIW